ncbi:hypothetical protein RSOLAG1IB_10334 [Rhizoctonia solani AG-1 IB]|jgi:hypothetical protein|uniref:Uncharacterized protein n=1 Tax=Thanatephorus cucumeris (strain AG1-IB / isolate 7/3/14) TaxID=1108050 RepID=A0A0B7FX36_THACB|nr:hypothetical protein RSOLAG1IB_10334 [Rhizoctonia solani AG-1 IB]
MANWEGISEGWESPGARARERPGDRYRDTETRGEGSRVGWPSLPSSEEEWWVENNKARVRAHVVCVRMSV